MHRQPKLTFYAINGLNCHKRRRKATNKNTTSNPKTTNHHTRNVLILSQAHGSQDHCSKCGDTRHEQGFSCPAKKYLCKACKKYRHFTSLCFSKQKKTAYQITAKEVENNGDSEMDEDPYSDDSFVLYQMRAKINMSTTQRRVPKKTHLIAKPPIQTEAVPNSSQISTGLARQMCRCQHHAKECVSDDVP